MGLILDSSVLIAAERKGRYARQALAEIAARAAGEDVALSVVTVLLIAATALELGYRIATGNVRHFQRVPGAAVVAF